MTQRCLRRAAAAVALAMVLGFTAPAHAAGRQVPSDGWGWIAEAFQWIARVWTAGEGGKEEPGLKAGMGIDPNGVVAPVPPPPPSSDAGYGIDPDG
ncbi:MAG TPA: hypothetical protein VKK31_09015 [Thermoanaerobaculia bacterium]|nr:hypothetical protein [Thermoanaerobaculia bacterium]